MKVSETITVLNRLQERLKVAEKENELYTLDYNQIRALNWMFRNSEVEVSIIWAMRKEFT